MICRYCGNTVDAESTVCPYCGSALVGYNAPISFEEDPQFEEDNFEEQEEYARPKKKGVKLPAVPFSTILSLVCALFSFICLSSYFLSSVVRMFVTMSDSSQLHSSDAPIRVRLNHVGLVPAPSRIT